jgi:hypothetical protein
MERIQSLASAEAVGLDGNQIAFNFDDRETYARVKVTAPDWDCNQITYF